MLLFVLSLVFFLVFDWAFVRLYHSVRRHGRKAAAVNVGRSKKLSSVMTNTVWDVECTCVCGATEGVYVTESAA